jgi:hypothetical protein
MDKDPKESSEPQVLETWANHVYRDRTLVPAPAYQNVPDWYRKATLFHLSNDIKDLQVSNRNGRDTANLTFKHCAPFLDAVTMGYHYVTPIDIRVEVVDDEPKISWKDPVVRPIETRGYVELPVPPGCWPIHYIWDQRWGFRTPPGYSVLITQPMNRYDLPWITMSGVQDTDDWYAPNAITFFLRKDFEGTVPAGTPMFSVIPFRREDWNLRINHDLSEEGGLLFEKKRTRIFGYYKEKVWKRKKYR